MAAAGQPNHLALYNGRIYWTMRGTGPITSAALDGTGVTPVTGNKDNAWDIFVNADGVFWTGGVTGIADANSAGYVEGRLTSSGSDTVYATSLTNARSVFVNAGEVVFASSNTDCVRRLPLAGGTAINGRGCTPTPVVGILGPNLWLFTTDGDYRSLPTDFTNLAVSSGGGTLPNGVNTVRVLSTPNAIFASTADTDGGGIYMFNGVAAAALVDPNSAASPFSQTTVNPAVASHFAYAMALHGDWLYYTTQPRVSSGATGSVFRINTVTPGPVENLLSPNVQNIRRYGLVIDPPWIIFAQESNIARIPLPQ